MAAGRVFSTLARTLAGSLTQAKEGLAEAQIV